MHTCGRQLLTGMDTAGPLSSLPVLCPTAPGAGPGPSPMQAGRAAAVKAEWLRQAVPCVPVRNPAAVSAPPLSGGPGTGAGEGLCGLTPGRDWRQPSKRLRSMDLRTPRHTNHWWGLPRDSRGRVKLDLKARSSQQHKLFGTSPVSGR